MFFRITRPINQNLIKLAYIKSISGVPFLTSNSSIHRTLWTTLVLQKTCRHFSSLPLGLNRLQFVISCIWAHKQLMEDAIEEWQSSAEDNKGDDLSLKGQSFPLTFDSLNYTFQRPENDVKMCTVVWCCIHNNWTEVMTPQAHTSISRPYSSPKKTTSL